MKKERKLKNFKKVVAIVFIFFIFVNFVGNYSNQVCYAAVNSLYDESDLLVADNLDKTIEQNWLVDIIGEFIYVVTSLAENLFGWMFEKLTGTSSFPWADKILFNAVPLLDINFINPSNGSLYKNAKGNATVISKVIQNTYYTVFTISVAFLGVCVGIMALRLIFASIASEKAKYKKAITQWLVSFLLLFLSHYLISFIFFVNEKMVEVASSIVQTSLDKLNKKAVELTVVEKSEKEKLIKNLIKDVDTDKWIDVVKGGVITGITTAVNPFAGAASMVVSVRNSFSNLKANLENDMKLLYSDKYLDYAYYLIVDRYYVSKEMPNIYDTGDKWYEKLGDQFVTFFTSSDNKQVKNYISDVTLLASLDDSKITSISDAYDIIYAYVMGDRGKDKEYLVNILLGVWERKNFSYDKVSSNDIFTGMGQFFKFSAWTYKRDDSGQVVGWKASKNSIIGTILYAIFLVQSVMYFIAYFKRFFYVTILAMFAPIVIVFDFLTKSIV